MTEMSSPNDNSFPEKNGSKNGGREVSETVLSIDSSKMTNGSVVSFHKVSYAVPLEKICCGSCRATERKEILREVSGILRPGLNAIMGSTGSGKSTLLDILANRKDPQYVEGNVYLDGRPIPKNFQYLSGYVVQHNLFVATLTVREALWFSANLRLPRSVTDEDKSAKIEQILNDLGLQSCADTQIGDDLIRGISGGEKKRTSIAIELILEPLVLFLDEPTTGLDAATAWSVTLLLKKLANQGHTIVCSIHQPRYGIYKLFDTLTLLSHGYLVYQGIASETLNYFEVLGYACETHDNPADFYLDVLNGGHEKLGNLSPSGHFENKRLDLTDSLKESFEASNIKRNLDSELQQIKSSAPETKEKPGKMFVNGFRQQFKVLLVRTGKNMIRHPQLLITNAALSFIISIVFGIVYLQSPDSLDKGVQNRLGVMFFICINLLFGASFVIDKFTKERAIFVHEHVSGYYSVSSYFLAKVFADLVPLRTIPPIVLTLSTYWMVGLKAEAGAVFVFLLTAVLMGYAAVGIGLFCSAMFEAEIGRLAMILTSMFTIIFSGQLVNLDSMGNWLSWLQYFSICRYTLLAFAINEFRGKIFTQCENSTLKAPVVPLSPIGSVGGYEGDIICHSMTGETFLHRTLATGTPTDDVTDWHLWQNIFALACINVGLYVLTYIQLLRRKMYS